MFICKYIENSMLFVDTKVLFGVLIPPAEKKRSIKRMPYEAFNWCYGVLDCDNNTPRFLTALNIVVGGCHFFEGITSINDGFDLPGFDHLFDG